MLKLVGRTCPRFNVPCFADKCSDEHCAAMDQQTITEGQDVTKPKATAPPVKNIELVPNCMCPAHTAENAISRFA